MGTNPIQKIKATTSKPSFILLPDLDLNPSKDIHSLFRNSIAIDEGKKTEAQRFSTIIIMIMILINFGIMKFPF